MLALDANVRLYNRGAGQLLEELKTAVERLGALEDLAIRLARIEKAVNDYGQAR